MILKEPSSPGNDNSQKPKCWDGETNESGASEFGNPVMSGVDQEKPCLGKPSTIVHVAWRRRLIVFPLW